MVQTQLEQVGKSQGELLNEMSNNMNDHDVRVMTRGGRMTEEPLYPEGHPKIVEQDSQRINVDAPSPSKKKKEKKNDGTLHTSSEPEVENLLRIVMMFLFPMLKHNLVMNIHLVTMIMTMMMFM